MNATRIGITLTGLVALLSVVLACSTVWLVLTSPTAVAGALDRGSISPLAHELTMALVTALRGLLAYL
ncbi:MAG: hypothetical protein ACM3NQ_08365 [Bacteroidales bacterium]